MEQVVCQIIYIANCQRSLRDAGKTRTSASSGHLFPGPATCRQKRAFGRAIYRNRKPVDGGPGVSRGSVVGQREDVMRDRDMTRHSSTIWYGERLLAPLGAAILLGSYWAH